MEKLLKLLNQFEKARIDKVNAEGLPYNIKLSFRPYTEEALINKAYKGTQLEICSKYYGFINWLVDNEEIDLEKLLKAIKENKIYCGKWGKVSNMLLMLLSIQDEPISFLISVLKQDE